MVTGKQVFVINFLIITAFRDASGEVEEPRCRDKFALVPEYIYRGRTCSTCFYYLLSDARTPYTLGPDFQTLISTGNIPNIESPVRPDVHNATSMQVICDVLMPYECDRWRTCCEKAAQCCQRQKQSLPNAEDSCPRTWDGFSCWDDTAPGVRATTRCPYFVDYFMTSKQAIKECTVNGTWLTIMKNEWTDYNPCVDRRVLTP